MVPLPFRSTIEINCSNSLIMDLSIDRRQLPMEKESAPSVQLLNIDLQDLANHVGTLPCKGLRQPSEILPNILQHKTGHHIPHNLLYSPRDFCNDWIYKTLALDNIMHYQTDHSSVCHYHLSVLFPPIYTTSHICSIRTFCNQLGIFL